MGSNQFCKRITNFVQLHFHEMFLKRAHITRIESELNKSILAMKMHQNGNSPSEKNVTPLFIVGFSAADLISRDCI